MKSGGAIWFYLIGSQGFTLAFCHFHNNYGQLSGGAIHLFKFTRFFLKGSNTFKYNHAGFGGAIYCRHVGINTHTAGVYIDDSLHIVGNKATDGGAIYVVNSRSAVVTIVNNTAENRGGGIFLNDSRSLIKMNPKSQILLHQNKVLSSKGKGGAIFILDTMKSCYSDWKCSVS